MKRFAIAALATIAFLSPASAQLGDAARGQQNFRACAPCHSLEPDRNMTGPSLANLWGRKAGSLPSFERYSEALKGSGIIWDDRSLDGWLTDPNRMVPDNEMPFNGIKDTRVRADLLAFLKDATKPGASQQTAQQGGMKGMSGHGLVRRPDHRLQTAVWLRDCPALSQFGSTAQLTRRGVGCTSDNRGFPLGRGSAILIRDRDRIYGTVVTRRLRAMGIRDRPTSPAAPRQNGFAERFLSSVQRSGLISSHAVLGGLHHHYARV
jgi:cytochrome c2